MVALVTYALLAVALQGAQEPPTTASPALADAQQQATVSIVGDIRRAGRYALAEGDDVASLIAKAEGFRDPNSNHQIRVLRRSGDATIACTASPQVRLKADDVLIVTTTTRQKVVTTCAETAERAK